MRRIRRSGAQVLLTAWNPRRACEQDGGTGINNSGRTWPWYPGPACVRCVRDFADGTGYHRPHSRDGSAVKGRDGIGGPPQRRVDNITTVLAPRVGLGRITAASIGLLV